MLISAKNIKLILFKELKDIFTSPLIYVLAGCFSLIMGWLFFNYLLQSKEMTQLTLTQGVLMPIYGNINFMFIFLSPLMTMRCFAEEKKQGTLLLLFLSQLSDFEIIIGKYVAVLFSQFFILFLTLFFPIVLGFSGYNDWGIVFTTYLGLSFSIAAYTSVGLFFSGLTDNQIVSAMLSFLFILGSMLLVISVNATQNYLLGLIVQYLTVPFHYEGFSRGIVRSYSFAYYISYVAFFLGLTHRVLESRKW